jgi:hypothetical protein
MQPMAMPRYLTQIVQQVVVLVPLLEICRHQQVVLAAVVRLIEPLALLVTLLIHLHHKEITADHFRLIVDLLVLAAVVLVP